MTHSQTRSPPRWQPMPVKADGAVVPGGWRHSIKRGETGLAIASAYRVPWNRIAAANGIDRDATLYVGRVLFIPNSAAAVAPRSASRDTSRPAPARPPSRRDPAMNVDDVITGSTPATAAAPRPSPRPAPTPAPPAPAVANIPALSWPVDGRVILSGFGPKASGRVNDGINIKAVDGATVRAATDGEVIYVGDAVSGFGLMLLLRHPGGVVTAYGHLKDSIATRGDRVQRGQPIAHAGTSGKASEPQLHFQLRSGRKALDPLRYLPG
ncbi:MAG: M23 family metallopeptidase [Paracoccaceae bacterium]